jgi:hypothetical protein
VLVLSCVRDRGWAAAVFAFQARSGRRAGRPSFFSFGFSYDDSKKSFRD